MFVLSQLKQFVPPLAILFIPSHSHFRYVSVNLPFLPLPVGEGRDTQFCQFSQKLQEIERIGRPGWQTPLDPPMLTVVETLYVSTCTGSMPYCGR